jgi:hypothetical protein
MNKAVKLGLVLGIVAAGITGGITLVYGEGTAHADPSVAHRPHVTACNVAELRGTYSFNGLGFAEQPPAPIPQYSLDIGGAFTIQDVGAAYFDGSGHVFGFTQEAIGTDTRENGTAFEGTYELHRGPHGEGCTGTWKLQDHHVTPPFDIEPPHVFKIALARGANGFHYTTVGGPKAALSGFATFDNDDVLDTTGIDFSIGALTNDDINGEFWQ